MFSILAVSWEPQLRGYVIVAIAVGVLIGGTYLVVGTNLGARLGFLVVLAGLFGWMATMGQFHFNQSDILHYFHLGDAIEYSLIHADGSLQTLVMGSDVLSGQQLQLHVPGGIWKASRLLSGSNGFGLISEAVSPAAGG